MITFHLLTNVYKIAAIIFVMNKVNMKQAYFTLFRLNNILLDCSTLLLMMSNNSYITTCTGGIIWEVEGRGSGSKGVAYHTDSPTQVEDFDLGW